MGVTTTATAEEDKKQEWKSGTPRLQTWLRDVMGKQYAFLQKNDRAGLVHRLDVQTSGPLLVGTNYKAYEALRHSLHKRKFYKEYLALMHGAVPPKQCCGTLTYKLLSKQEHGRGWRTEVNKMKGDHAATKYEAIAAYRCRDVVRGGTQRYTLMRMELVTGRTHQIRVHLQAFARDLGLTVHGIVGDYKYLPSWQVRQDRRICTRVFLHAHRLHFPVVQTPNEMHVECPLPPELKRALRKLELDERMTDMFVEQNKRGSEMSHPSNFQRVSGR